MIDCIFLRIVSFGSISHGRYYFFLSPCYRKDLKKVTKLEAQIPYHQGRGNKEEVEKIKGQVEAIWTKTREAAMA